MRALPFAITVPVETGDLHRPLMVARVSPTGDLHLELPAGCERAHLAPGAASALVNWLVSVGCRLRPEGG